MISEGWVADHHSSRRIRLPNLSPPLRIGLLMLGMIFIAVTMAPWLTPFDPIEQDLSNRFAPPSRIHPFGTDNFGRDMFARVLYGGRVDLQIAFVATVLSLLTGSAVGLVAGYFGGWLDSVLMAVLNLVMAFPVFVLVIGILAMLGPGLINMYIAILAISWVAYARLIRGEVLVVKNLDYVEAARAIGARNSRIITRHILPNVATAAVVYAASDAVLNIIFAGTLGYLGLGIQPPNPEWGAMVAEARVFLPTHPNLTLLPAAAIVITGVAISLIGDGLAELLRK
ncbi:MAG: ABC transporter permease [Anaerolineales bacterium]|nr:ABC transporter permease [Anaerolineales bacterium]